MTKNDESETCHVNIKAVVKERLANSFGGSIEVGEIVRIRKIFPTGNYEVYSIDEKRYGFAFSFEVDQF